MAGDLSERGREVALVYAAVTDEAACAVNQYLIPDAARILVDHLVLREIEAVPGKVIDDVLGIVRDASGSVVVNDGDDIAMDGAAVNGAEFVFKKHQDPLYPALVIAAAAIETDASRARTAAARIANRFAKSTAPIQSARTTL
jgi:hypothetical protein